MLRQPPERTQFIVAQIGLGLGVLSEALYGLIVFMAVARTLVTPPLLAMLVAGET